MTYLPPIAHLSPMTTIRREWRLPAPGTVAVRVNENVNARDTVAEAEVPERRVFLDIARAMNVPANLANRYLTCEVGDRLSAGDRIAEIKGILRRTVRAPGNGRVIAISEGRVLFEVIGTPYELRARFPCLIGGSDGVQAITAETTGALIQAAWGNGRRDYGVLRLVGDGPGDQLTVDKLDTGLWGSILIAGSCNHAAPLHQATELSAHGLILGGLAASMIPVARRLSYPVVVLEGFGNIPINSAAYNLLSANQGTEASLDAAPSRPYEAHRPEIIIPLTSTRSLDLPEDVIPLSPGVRVHVVRRPHMGAVGVVTELLTRAVRYPSGNMARSARLDLEGTGSVVVPLANLEVLQ